MTSKSSGLPSTSDGRIVDAAAWTRSAPWTGQRDEPWAHRGSISINGAQRLTTYVRTHRKA